MTSPRPPLIKLLKRSEPKERVALLIGTWFGSAFLGTKSFPMPGTWGTLAAVPLVWWSHQWPVHTQVLFWVALCAVAIWGVNVSSKIFGSKDHSYIVIDEVLGLAVAAWCTQNDLAQLALAFVLFRGFDILKPPPIRQVDRWSKFKGGNVAAFGVILDDLFAGVFTLICLLLAQNVTERWAL